MRDRVNVLCVKDREIEKMEEKKYMREIDGQTLQWIVVLYLFLLLLLLLLLSFSFYIVEPLFYFKSLECFPAIYFISSPPLDRYLTPLFCTSSIPLTLPPSLHTPIPPSIPPSIPLTIPYPFTLFLIRPLTPSYCRCVYCLISQYVINYSFPLTVEDYVHRIGRTGRGGATGISHTFFTDFDKVRK